MKRIVLIAVLLGVLGAGAILVLPGLIDWNKYRGEIVAQLHAATGYEYRIGGDIDFAVLPYPRLKLADLAVTNPPSGEQPLLTLREAAVSVQLMPLLKGRVVVDSVALENPVLRLEVAADGTASWMTPALEERLVARSAPPAAKNGIAEAVSLDSIKIKNGSFSYADRRSGTTYAAEQINLDIRGDTLSGPFTANGDALYGGQKILLALKTGRINVETNSIAVQTDIEIPDSGTAIVFSGVTGLSGLDVQGSASVATADAGGLALFAGKPAISALAGKSLSVSGILTAASSQIAYKDLKISYAGSDAAGSLVVSHLKGGGAPPDIAIVLDAAQPLDIAGLIPAGGAEKKKTTGSFLPESLTMPDGLTASLGLSAPGLKNNGMVFGPTRLVASMKGQVLEGTINTAPPGGGRFDATGTLSFGSASRAEKAGTVTLSEPSLSYRINLVSEDGAKTALALVPDAKIQKILPLLHEGLRVDAAGSATPSLVKIEAAELVVGKNKFSLGSSYARARQGGRPLLTAALSAQQLDIDALMTRVNQPARDDTSPAALPEGGKALPDVISRLSLPFDLDLTAAAKNVRLKGVDYQILDIQAHLTDKKLDLKTLQLKDKKGNDFLLAGTAADIAALKGLDFRAQGKTPDLKALLEGLGVNTTSLPASLSKAELVSAFTGEADKLSFTANVKAMGGTAEAKGVLAHVLKTPAVSDLILRLRHPDYAAIVKLFNPEFKSATAIGKTLDLYTVMKRDGKVYSFTEMNVTVGPAVITGDLKADMGGVKPAIAANLKTGDFPLGALLGYEPKAGGKSSAPATGTRWSRNAINAEWVHKFNLALKASSESFSYGTWTLTDAIIDVTLTDGALNVTQLDGGMYGGKASLNGVMSSSGKPREPLTLSGKASLQDISLESFVSAFSGAKPLRARGTISLDSVVRSAGISPAALIFALQGEGKANGTDLVFEGFDLARLSRTLAQPSSSMTENATGLLNAAMSGGSTSFDTLSSAFTITEGVVNFSDLTLTGKDAVVSTLGTINLPSWTVDLESAIDLTVPADAPPLKVVFRGPLDQPGKTFGRSAMEGYIQQMIGDKVQDAIRDKLQDKLKADEARLLQNLLGVPPPPADDAPTVQQEALPPPFPVPAPISEPAPQSSPEAVPETPPQPEAGSGFNDVLKSVIQGQ